MLALEAVVRHGSFTITANELCVTPDEVTQRIKPLEAWSGAGLFKRPAPCHRCRYAIKNGLRHGQDNRFIDQPELRAVEHLPELVGF